MQVNASFGPINRAGAHDLATRRSEEHTSELQSQSNLVCRLLLEKKKNLIISSAMPRNPIVANHLPYGSVLTHTVLLAAISISIVAIALTVYTDNAHAVSTHTLAQ